MANVRVKDKTAITGASVDAADVFFITDTSVDKDMKIVASELKAYILDAKILGGSAAGDVTTNNGTQTLTGKTLTSPKVNEPVAVTAKATEINKLTGCTATTAELNLTHTYAAKIPYLANVTSDIQGQINGLSTIPTALTHSYGVRFTASDVAEKIVEDTILTAIGLSPSTYYVDASSIVATGYTVATAYYTAFTNMDLVIATEETSGVRHLLDITLGSITAATEYVLAITFKVIEIPGV